MSKTLSLKKKGAPTIGKDQKSIRQFFKTHVKPVEVSSSLVTENSKAVKRKTVSPCGKTDAELTCENPVLDTKRKVARDVCENGKINHTPKKQKNCRSPGKRAPEVLRRSPRRQQTIDLTIANENSDTKEVQEVSPKKSLFRNVSPQKARKPILVVEQIRRSPRKHKSSPSLHVNGNIKSITPEKPNAIHASAKSPKKCLFPNHSLGQVCATEDVHKDTVDPMIRRSPRKPLHEVSPNTQAVKDLNDDEELAEIGFGDDWDSEQWEQLEEHEALNLAMMQRCEVAEVRRQSTEVELQLIGQAKQRAACVLQGIWKDLPLEAGEVVSVIARVVAGRWLVDDCAGLLVRHPDHLLSSTSVVAGVFCRRKAVMQERFRGLDSANIAMTVGVLVHELLQTALQHGTVELTALRMAADELLASSVRLLYDAGLTLAAAREAIHAYLPQVQAFMQQYVAATPSVPSAIRGGSRWGGRVEEVLDIEENVCCPQLGLKGKIDATVQVTIHERSVRRRWVAALELKTGRASESAEHRGQLIMYGMMLALQRGADPTAATDPNLLLYLKDTVNLKAVSGGYPEKRDIIMLRNQLAHYLAPKVKPVAGKKSSGAGDAANLEDVQLENLEFPEPIHHKGACVRCPYLTPCSLHLWHTEKADLSANHPLSQLRSEALGHLTQAHVDYFLHWAALLMVEERDSARSPLHRLWTEAPSERELRGRCLADASVLHVERSGGQYVHTFSKSSQHMPGAKVESESGGLQEGAFVVVSGERPWLAAGPVVGAAAGELRVALERDLRKRYGAAARFHVDAYESASMTSQNLTNLAAMLGDDERAARLRSLIVDGLVPEFEDKLGREVGRVGARLMRGLNVEQQRAVLRALAARHYALLEGMPGTGKTQTVCVLVQMLVALGKRVLVTAHTHSAVDNVLSRLPGSLRVLRLGARGRAAPALAARCEEALAANCTTPEQLEALYDSMEVVGVTCLGAAHALLSRTTFDVCIVDEATQVLQSTVLRPLLCARRFVLVGDPEQLPPVVRSRAARRLGLDESLFSRLRARGATVALRLQYRMCARVAALANRLAYAGRLRCASDAVRHARLALNHQKVKTLYEVNMPWLVTSLSTLPEHAVLMLDTGNTAHVHPHSSPCTNPAEALVLLALLSALHLGGVRGETVGVLAPYREQVALLRRATAALGSAGAVEVSTVDQFQGRDKDVIIYSCCKTWDRSRGPQLVKEGEILEDGRRLAVGITRARHKLIVIGDTATLRHYTPFAQLLSALGHPVLKSDVDLKAASNDGAIEKPYTEMAEENEEKTNGHLGPKPAIMGDSEEQDDGLAEPLDEDEQHPGSILQLPANIYSDLEKIYGHLL